MGVMEDYAGERGLTFAPERELRAVTPLLLAGGGGSTRNVSEGTLAGGLEGLVAHHVHDGVTSGPREFTVVVSRIPESLGFVRALSCRSRAVDVVRSYTKIEFLGKWRELRLESEKFNRLYSLEVLEGQREGWLRQLFSPSFIDRLASEASEGFCFELNEGHLCVAEPRHLGEPAELDALCEAAADVAARIRQESLEDVGSGEEYGGDRAYEARLREQAAKVKWPTPPDTPRVAARAYQSRTGVGVKAYLRALAWGLALGGIGAAIGLLGPFDSGTGVIIAVIAGLVGVLAAILVLSAAAGPLALRIGLEAFIVEYARSHGYELEDRYAFHARNPTLPLPGRASHAMRGRMPSGADFTLAFCDDTAEMFSHGKRVYISGDRPLSADVVVAEIGEGEGNVPEPPEGLKSERHDGLLVIWRGIAGNMDRSRAGLDQFVTQADEMVRGARGERTP